MEAPTQPTDTDRDRTTDDAAATPDRDEAFRLLQSDRRRRVVRHLLEAVDEPVPVEALATAVARAEADDPAGGLDPGDRDRVAISLDHSHLPTLEAAGVVDHDRPRDRVTATPAIEALEPFLDLETGAAAGDDRGSSTPLAGGPGGNPETPLSLRGWIAAAIGTAVLLALAATWLGRRGERRRDR